MTFSLFFLFSLPRSGSAGTIELGSNPDPDLLKHWLPDTTYRELVYDNFHVDYWYIFNAVQMYESRDLYPFFQFQVWRDDLSTTNCRLPAESAGRQLADL